MKKLALILLLGIYSSAVFGAGTGSFLCCDTAAFTFTNSIQNKFDAVTASNEDCGNSHHNAAFTNHHIAAASIHFSSRNFHSVQPHTGVAGFTATAVLQSPLISASNSTTTVLHNAVPVYILHCVYRL